MEEHDRALLDKLFGREKTDCRKEFMTLKAFYRSIVIGVLASLALVGSVFTWVLGVSSNTVAIETTVKTHTFRIANIEEQQAVQYRDQMKILTEIREKVSK